MGIASAIDAGIAALSPSWALSRSRARLLLKRTEQYAAAKTSRSTGTWSPAGSNVNDIIGNSAYAVRNRVRQLVRDFPYFVRAVNASVDYVVGSGIKYQARVKRPDGKLDTPVNNKIEDALARWMDGASVCGKLHFYELMRLAKRQELECGEWLALHTWQSGGRNISPYALQMVEPDQLSTEFGYAKNIDKSKTISQGIEYDKSTGRPIAYYISDESITGNQYYTNPIIIQADRVMHGFETLRPGQLRGISPLVAAVLMARDLSDYLDAEMDAAKMSAKWLAFVTSPDPLAMQSPFAEDINGNKIEELENGIIEYLRTGEKVDIASNPRPGSNFPPTVRMLLTMLAVVANIPYEILSGDYQGMSYSVGKMIRVDFSQSLRPLASRHIRQFCEPAKNMALDALVISGAIDLPGYWRDPWRYRAGEWQPPGMDSIDPQRESKAYASQVLAGLRSPQEITASRGRDLEEVYNEIKAADELAKELGITVNYGTPSTAIANNPAALDEQNKPKEDSKKEHPEHTINVHSAPVTVSPGPVNISVPAPTIIPAQAQEIRVEPRIEVLPNPPQPAPNVIVESPNVVINNPARRTVREVQRDANGEIARIVEVEQ